MAKKLFSNYREDVEPKESDALLAETVIKNAYHVGNKLIAEVPISLMRIDDSYQRLVQNNIKKLMRNWNDEECQSLLVSYRDGYFYIMDGQHRFVVANVKNISHLVCEIYTGLSREQEAERFAKQNDNITRLTTYDTFKANLVYKEKVDCSIKKVCDKYNISVEKSNRAKNLKSVSSARTIVRNNGEKALEWILSVISDANWEDFTQSYGGDMLEALYYTMQMNSNDLVKVKKNLVAAMCETNPVELIGIGNAKYPNYGRRMRLKMIINALAKGESLDDIKVA